MKLLHIWKLARIAAGNEEGGITVLSLFLFIVMLMAAGLLGLAGANARIRRKR